MRRIDSAILLLGGACFALTCRAPVETAAERPFEVLVATDAETLDPRVSTDAVGVRISRLLHAGLFRLDAESLKPVPYLAKHYEWLSARELRVELRTDVQFASGATFTAEDVVATFAAFRSHLSRHRRVVEAISGVVAESPSVVRFALGRDHGTLLSDLELPILRHDQAGVLPSSEFSAQDGLGPYRLARREPGALHLAPRKNGALPEPKHALVIRTVRDENARALRMRGGAGDVAMNGFSPALLPPPAELAGLGGGNGSSGNHGGGLVIESRSAASLTYLLPRWKDEIPLVVRQALSLGWERQLFTETLFASHAEVARSLMPRTHWAFPGSLERSAPASGACYVYDPEAARRLLAQAGYAVDGSDPRLHLSLLTSTDRLRVSVARVAAQELARVGIRLEVRPLELGTMMARLGAGDFDLAILQMPELTEPNALKTFLHATSIPPQGANRGRVHDAELDRALDFGEREQDLAARGRAYRDAELRACEVLPIIPLWHERHVTLKSARAAAFHPSADGRWLSFALMP